MHFSLYVFLLLLLVIIIVFYRNACAHVSAYNSLVHEDDVSHHAANDCILAFFLHGILRT